MGRLPLYRLNLSRAISKCPADRIWHPCSNSWRTTTSIHEWILNRPTEGSVCPLGFIWKRHKATTDRRCVDTKTCKTTCEETQLWKKIVWNTIGCNDAQINLKDKTATRNDINSLEKPLSGQDWYLSNDCFVLPLATADAI